MAAQTKQELLALTKSEYRKLRDLIAGIPETVAAETGDDGISIKDTIAQRAHWVELLLKWYEDGKAGRVVHKPAAGHKWTDLKTYNAKVRKDSRARGWDEVKAELEAAHERLVTLVTESEESALYGKRLYDWMEDWTLGRWAEATGASHYRSARKAIRQILKEHSGAA
ncbi:ClbS/DfsB family four-helix bundle protein [Ostreiculturibacter nitratireducens]|uniref:ClbS/DfsB family four-helix bundle protein n=1 Tax=Ostreiculturibacter nitratireducens TaxID=3075226 RepID=UPI0031B5BAFD